MQTPKYVGALYPIARTQFRDDGLGTPVEVQMHIHEIFGNPLAQFFRAQ